MTTAASNSFRRRCKVVLSRRSAGWNETNSEETTMSWHTPKLVEICVGLEINGYLPPEY